MVDESLAPVELIAAVKASQELVSAIRHALRIYREAPEDGHCW
jgi:hypothetical protein